MNKKSWHIRKATLGDADNLKSCMLSAYTEYMEILDGQKLPPMEVDYKEEIASYPVWVVESDNKIVGGLILIFENDYLTIANIAVHPDFQGHGLGKGLMEFVDAEAKRHNYSELRLGTHVLLTGNISFYSKLGWIEIERDKTRVYMKKNI